MVNISFLDRIYARSGFRQGCRLSLYSFILCSQLLSKALIQSNSSIGIQIWPNDSRISHLLYAEDILFFLCFYEDGKGD